MPRREENNAVTPTDISETRQRRKARTEEGRENQMIALAINKVEERMMNGTASSQEYVHYLKLAANRKTQRLENEKLELELELVKAKTEALQSAKRNEELFEQAIKHMTIYQGHGEPDDYDKDLY